MFARRILAIVPAYNEELSLPGVVESIRTGAPEASILIVDDHSSDRTPDVARGLGVNVVSLPINLGIGGAVQTGYRYAATNGCEIAVQVDGDGQHDASQIRDLVAPIEEGRADVVIGSRYIEDRGYKTPLVRRIGMILFSLIASIVCRQKITDTTSGFRAISRKVIELYSDEYSSDFPDSESLILAKRRGFRILEIPVTMLPRKSGMSSIGLIKSLFYPYRVLLGIVAILLRKY